MIPIPASILAIENESDRDFMENIFFSYQRLIYHEIGSILNDPWSKDDIFQTVIVQLINNIDTLRPKSELHFCVLCQPKCLPPTLQHPQEMQL